MKETQVYKAIVNRVQARINCKDKGNDWYEQHTEDLELIIDNYLPRGSGFNLGTRIDFEKSHRNKLIFYSTFEYMDEGGMYTGAIDFEVIVTPDLLLDFDLKVKGPFSKLPSYCLDLKDFIEELFTQNLYEYIEEDFWK